MNCAIFRMDTGEVVNVALVVNPEEFILPDPLDYVEIPENIYAGIGWIYNTETNEWLPPSSVSESIPE